MSLDQKCRKMGTSATCCAIPNAICKRFADHPSRSLRARLRPEPVIAAPSRTRPSIGIFGQDGVGLGIHLDRSLGRHKIKIMPRRIDRLPNSHKLEMGREEAPQIFLVLEFVFVKSIALLAGLVFGE